MSFFFVFLPRLPARSSRISFRFPHFSSPRRGTAPVANIAFGIKHESQTNILFTKSKNRTRRRARFERPQIPPTTEHQKAGAPRAAFRILNKYAKKFQVRIYECAVCSNHVHCLAKAPSRPQLQNFFRVFSGQVAQQILRLFPLQKTEARAFRGGAHPKNQKSFWSLLAYTRLVSWGRDFLNVKSYVMQNTLEALGLIPYQKRPPRRLVFKTKK